MSIKAVITGDIVNSSKIEDKNKMIDCMYEIRDNLSEIGFCKKSQFEIYRGDSFQFLMEKPENAIKAAIITRSLLRINTHPPQKESAKLWDTRIGIGIGNIDLLSKKIIESSGEAFIFSGRKLDSIKGKHKRIAFQSPWKDINDEIDVSLYFADVLISEWSIKSSEIAILHYAKSLNQQQIAQHLNISQPAVHKRFKVARLSNLDLFIKRFEQVIGNMTNV